MPVYYIGDQIPTDIDYLLTITEDAPRDLGDLPDQTFVVVGDTQSNHQKIMGIVNRRLPLFVVSYENSQIKSKAVYFWQMFPGLTNPIHAARKQALGDDDWTWFHVPSQQSGPITRDGCVDTNGNRVSLRNLTAARQESAAPGNPSAAPGAPANPDAAPGAPADAAPANPGIINGIRTLLTGTVATVRQEMSAPGEGAAPVFEDDNFHQVEGFKVIGHSAFMRMVQLVRDATDESSSHRIILPNNLIPSDYNPANALVIPAREVKNGLINQTFSGKFRYRLQQDGISLGKFIKVCGTFFILLGIINLVFFLHDIGYAKWECLLVFVALTIIYSILTIKIYIDKV